MRHYLIPLLLASSLSLAAEPLSNAGMAKSYVESATCTSREGRPLPCTQDMLPQASVTKALQDAEHPGTGPLTNNPDALPPPATLPPPSLSQQEIQHRLELLGPLFNGGH